MFVFGFLVGTIAGALAVLLTFVAIMSGENDDD